VSNDSCSVASVRDGAGGQIPKSSASADSSVLSQKMAERLASRRESQAAMRRGRSVLRGHEASLVRSSCTTAVVSSLRPNKRVESF